MIVFAIDPGPERSAIVVWDPSTAMIAGALTAANEVVLSQVAHRVRRQSDVLVIEQVASFGMPVGSDVFETVFWSGRFAQAWTGYHAAMPFERVKRHEVKMHLCQHPRAKDSNIRQALIDRFGGKDRAIGRKASPGPLYNIKGDEWSALAVALTWADQHARRTAEAS